MYVRIGHQSTVKPVERRPVMYSLLTRVSNHMTQQLFNVCSCGKRIRFETPVTANVKKYTAGSMVV